MFTFPICHYGSIEKGWDISNASYDSLYGVVSSQTGTPKGVSFSTDGTEMYVLGQTEDTAYQYTLSTAWDVSTASYAGKGLYFGSQNVGPTRVRFNDDGTKLYMLGAFATDEYVYQYNLSTAWDISPGSYSGKRYFISQVSNSDSFVFSDDGTKMYVFDATSKYTYQYTLSTAWDITTASYDSKSFYSGSQNINGIDIEIKDDGSKFYLLAINGISYQYTLSTPFDISTASYDSVSFSSASQDSTSYGITFKPDGTKMYIAGRTNDRVYQYSI